MSGGDVEAGDHEPALRQAARQIAGAGGQIERPHARPHQAAPHQPLEQPVGIAGAVARIIRGGLAEIGGEFAHCPCVLVAAGQSRAKPPPWRHERGGITGDNEAELIVVGGGLVGLTLAIACAEGGIRTIVVEAESAEALTSTRL